MKVRFKSLLLGIAAAALPVAASAQCTPDRNACTVSESGLPGCLFPEVADTAYVGQSYDQTVQLNFLRVAPAPPNPLNITEVFISRLVLEDVRNLPAGLSVRFWSGNAADDVNGQERGTFTAPNTDTPIFGCARFTGTAAEPNTSLDSLEFVFRVFVRLVVNGQIAPQEIDPNNIVQGFNPVAYAYRMPVAEPAGRKWLNGGAEALRVHPNPTNGKLLLTSLPVLPLDVEVCDLTGRVLLSGLELSADSPTIDVSSLPQGLYMIRARNASGETSFAKFAKQ